MAVPLFQNEAVCDDVRVNSLRQSLRDIKWDRTMRRRDRACQICAGIIGLIAAALAISVRGQSQDLPGHGQSVARAGSTNSVAQSPGQTMKFRATRRPDLRQEPPAQPAADSKGVFALDPGEAEWTLWINDQAEILVFYRGVQVLKGSYTFWAEGTQWASAQLAAVGRTRHQVGVRGVVDRLSLKVQGVALPLSSRELRLELDVTASAPFSNITGGGVTWTLNLDSPSFAGKPGDPKLLLDKTGWRWPVTPEQELIVRFDAPLPRLFFEKDQKHEIRSNFVGDRIRPGRARIGLTVTLPEGGLLQTNPDERYPRPTGSWFRQPLRWDASPVDLSFLNAGDRPAGRHGFVRADGAKLVFQDGTPARFWGTNLSGPALFTTPRANIALQARRIAQLGYNLVRIVQHEANWVSPNIFGKGSSDTRHLDPRSLDAIDLWIKCLKDEGVYVWLDMHYLRALKPADGVKQGWSEIDGNKGIFWGFNYVNPELVQLMSEFQHQYLNHVNIYTRIAYKDDPAVMGVLLTNENDLTFHFGVIFLPNHHHPIHKEMFDRELEGFAKATGLPAGRLGRTWEPGPAKYLLNELEHRFNRTMIDELRADGLRAPIATTSLWGQNILFSLPALTDSDVIDTHAYGTGEALSANPRYLANFLSWAAMGHVHGKPLTITEWNVPYPAIDRFTAPLYVASIASLQGWDAPMIYNYSQIGLDRPGPEEWSHRINKWSTFYDPAISGIMPAAAIAYRRRHISPARTAYCLKLAPEQLFGTLLGPENTATIRTLVEQSRLTIAMPAVPELPWLKPSEPSGDVKIVTDPNHDFIPEGESQVRSDTGELSRSWKEGIQTIDTPRTQAVSGWIGGKLLETKDATFQFKTRTAVVAVTSIDDLPIDSSRFLMITAVGQGRPSPATHLGKVLPDRTHEHLPFLSEPVIGSIAIRTKTGGLELLALSADGKVVGRATPPIENGSLTIALPALQGTHWYLLKARPQSPKREPASGSPP
jgi:hypothetical protein